MATSILPAAKKPSAQILNCEIPDTTHGVVSINGKHYAYRTVSRSMLSETVAHVRLFTGDGFTGDVYDAVLLRDGREDCSCADFTFRGALAGRRCKHLQALVDVGLLGDIPHEFDENECV